MKQRGSAVTYLKPHLYAVISAPLLMALEVACDLAQPQILSRVVDTGIRQGNFEYAQTMCLIMICIALVGAVGGFGCTYFASKAAMGFGADLREGLFSASLSLNRSQQIHFTPNTLLTRLLNDVSQLQNIVIILLRIMVRSPLLVVGGIAMILATDADLACHVLWPLPFLSLLVIWILTRSYPLFAKVQDRLDKLGGIIRENLSAIRVVKAFSRSREEIGRFNERNSDLAFWSIKANRSVGAALPLVQLLLNFCMIALVLVGGKKVLNSELPIGDLMASVNYLTQILFSLMLGSMMIMTVTRGTVSLRRVDEILTAANENESTLPSSKDHPFKEGITLELSGVEFCYPQTTRPALTGITATVKAGQSLAILGSTGAGKSTLAALLLRFFSPQTGIISANGISLEQIDDEIWKSHIAWIPQTASLFSGTIRENIAWGKREASPEEITIVAKTAQADSFITELHNGYDTLLGQRGVNLSGGQKQRISIARALVRKPKLLILDDATSALDTETESRLWNAVSADYPEITRVVITQRIQTAAACESILVLDEGRMVGSGTHETLLAGNSVYREIWQSQFGEIQ